MEGWNVLGWVFETETGRITFDGWVCRGVFCAGLSDRIGKELYRLGFVIVLYKLKLRLYRQTDTIGGDGGASQSHAVGHRPNPSSRHTILPHP